MHKTTIMKIFREFEKGVSYAFTRPNPIQPQRYGINYKTIPIFAISVFGWIGLLFFFYDEVETVEQYSETIYALNTVACITSVFAIFDRKQKEMFKLIDMFEDIIKARKLRKCSRSSEKIS